jgi:hypothetical protein
MTKPADAQKGNKLIAPMRLDRSLELKLLDKEREIILYEWNCYEL